MEADAVFKRVGRDKFIKLVAAFYRRIPEDDLIGPLYPEQDWEGAEQRLREFLLFRFGGERDYFTSRGHPRLRARHLPFRIGLAERDRWLELMGAALDEVEIGGGEREALDQFFFQVADFMRNVPGEDSPASGGV